MADRELGLTAGGAMKSGGRFYRVSGELVPEKKYQSAPEKKTGRKKSNQQEAVVDDDAAIVQKQSAAGEN